MQPYLSINGALTIDINNGIIKITEANHPMSDSLICLPWNVNKSAKYSYYAAIESAV